MVGVQQLSQCPIKALILVWNDRHKYFTGIVPLEQEKFINILKQVLSDAQQQKAMLQQEQQQQQQQAQQAQQGQQTGRVSPAFAGLYMYCMYIHGTGKVVLYSIAVVLSNVNIHIRLSLELSCYYWCWCSVLGDLIIPADSSSTSLDIGLSITFKAGVELLRWLWGAVAQWSEYLQLKQEALGSIPAGYPGFFFHFQLTY